SDLGLILPISQWILEAACSQIKLWENKPPAQQLQLAVNISVRQFYQPDFVERVCAILEKTAIHPSRLKLELTENLVRSNIDDAIIKMLALKKIGVHFSMDNFGIGCSSLPCLAQLPLEQLKIDQSFVSNIGIKSSDNVIVQIIIGMAGNLNLEVIAEGVETEEQRAFLKLNGCSNYQGYLLGRPMPIEEFECLLGV
ncbi:MAG: EAL domain-containing protein, partial [Methylovulum sp.]